MCSENKYILRNAMRQPVVVAYFPLMEVQTSVTAKKKKKRNCCKGVKFSSGSTNFQYTSMDTDILDVTLKNISSSFTLHIILNFSV